MGDHHLANGNANVTFQDVELVEGHVKTDAPKASGKPAAGGGRWDGFSETSNLRKIVNEDSREPHLARGGVVEGIEMQEAHVRRKAPEEVPAKVESVKNGGSEAQTAAEVVSAPVGEAKREEKEVKEKEKVKEEEEEEEEKEKERKKKRSSKSKKRNVDDEEYVQRRRSSRKKDSHKKRSRSSSEKRRRDSEDKPAKKKKRTSKHRKVHDSSSEEGERKTKVGEKVSKLKSLIKNAGFKMQGITPDMTEKDQLKILKQFVKDHAEEGLSEKLSKDQVRALKEKRDRIKEVQELQKVKLVGDGKRRRKAKLSKVDYYCKFPETGIDDIDKFKTPSTSSSSSTSSSDYK